MWRSIRCRWWRTTGALRLTKNLLNSKHMKQVDIKHHFVQTAVLAKFIHTVYTLTDEQPGNVRTKALDRKAFDNRARLFITGYRVTKCGIIIFQWDEILWFLRESFSIPVVYHVLLHCINGQILWMMAETLTMAPRESCGVRGRKAYILYIITFRRTHASNKLDIINNRMSFHYKALWLPLYTENTT